MTRYTHDAAGQRIETSSSTLTTVYGYDSVGNLLTQATSGASEIAFSYSYNKNGYITGEVRKENGTTTSTYAYDALGQLTSFLQSTGYGEQYAYDKAGNMTEKVLTGTDGIETALKMSYNKANQLTGMANGKDKMAATTFSKGSFRFRVLSFPGFRENFCFSAASFLIESANVRLTRLIVTHLTPCSFVSQWTLPNYKGLFAYFGKQRGRTFLSFCQVLCKKILLCDFSTRIGGGWVN